MLNKKIIKFGTDIIDFLMNDSRFSFADNDLKIFLDGLSPDNKEIADFISDANKIYFNSADEQLHGSYLTCDITSEPDSKIKKTIRFNLDAYYEDCMKSSFDEICSKMAGEIINQLESKDGNTINEIFSTDNYETFRSNLMIRLLNFPTNCVRLENTVYDRFEDIAICSYIKVAEINGQFTSSKVTKDFLEKFHVTAEQIKHDALINSSKMFPPRVFFSIFEMSDMNNSFSLDEALELVESGRRVISSGVENGLTITNSKALNGAAVMFYPDVQAKISGIMGGDYYVAFISTHFAAIHPIAGIRPSKIRNSLASTNNFFADDNDSLTNLVFKYDSRRNILKKL